MKAFAILSALSVAAAATNEIVNRQASDSTSTTTVVVANATTTSSGIPISVELVLLTALPSSLLALAETNPASASALIASELEHTETPSWFAALPTNIQTYLIAQGTVTAAAAVTTTLLTSPSNVTIGPGPAIITSTVRNTTSVFLPIFTTYANGSTAANGTIIANNGTAVAGNGTAVAGLMTASASRATTTVVVLTTGTAASAKSSSGVASATGTSTGITGVSTGAAAIPTAVLGAGFVGAMGLLGMLAL